MTYHKHIIFLLWVIILAPPVTLVAQTGQTCTITGVVYRDYDYDGARDNNYVTATLPTTESRHLEPAVTGLTITAYDSAGNAFVATVNSTPNDSTTGNYGRFTFTGLEDNESYRIEFTGISSSDFSGVVGASGSNTPVRGTNASDTSVQFVDCSPNTTINGVDFSVSNPYHYCQRNDTDFSGDAPDIEYVTTCYARGDQTENLPTLVRGDNTAINHWGVANDFDTGAVMAISYHRGTRRAFAASFQRRTAGFRCNPANLSGPSGNAATTCNAADANSAAANPALADSSSEAGVIYLFDPHIDLNISSAVVSEFIDLNDVGITVTGIHTGVGGSTYVFEQLSGETGFDTVWNAVGRRSFGDMDIYEDYTGAIQERIYVVVLDGAGSIVEIPFNTDTGVPVATGSVTQMPLASPTCAGDLRPGALKVFNGFVYYGLTCTGPTQADLRGYVYRFPVSGSAAGAVQVADFPLNYERANPTSRICDGNNLDETGARLDVNNTGNWRPWENRRILIVADSQQDCLTRGYIQAIYPQPWLLDIEFDEYNFMLVGIADRASLQLGSNTATGNGGAPANGTSQGVSSGDTLILAPNDDQNPTSWLAGLENDGIVGSNLLQRESPVASAANTDVNGHTTGPGGREFFTGERYKQSATPDHAEISLGNLGYILGSGEVVSSAIDPDAYNVGGLIWLSSHTGGQLRNHRLSSGGGAFDKAAGVGDIEFLCAIPPLEIGNRVWLDTDLDGIQDPNEIPFDGVTVNLYFDGDGDGEPDDPNNPVATAITANGGQYYFVENGNNHGGPGTAELPNESSPGSNNGLFVYGANYVIRLDNPADYASGGALFNSAANIPYFVTAANTSADIRDSDGLETTVGGLTFPQVAFNIGFPGENNHTYDFGFSETPPRIPVVGAPTDPVSTPVLGGELESVVELPKTGETPYYRGIQVILIIGLVILLVGVFNIRTSRTPE